MSRSPSRMSRLLARREQTFQRACDELERGDHAALDTSLATLSRVNALIAVGPAAASNGPGRLFSVLLLAAIVVAVLLSASYRLPSAYVDMRVVSAAVRVRGTDVPQEATNLLRLSSVTFAQAERIEAPEELGLLAETSALRLEGAAGAITWKPLELQPKDLLAIEKAEQPGLFRVSLEPGDKTRAVALEFSLTGALRVKEHARAGGDRPVTLDAPRGLTVVWPIGQPAVMQMATMEPQLLRRLDVSTVDFVRTTVVDRARRSESTIMSGEVRFPDYNVTPVTLRESDHLIARNLVGTLRQVRVDEHGLVSDVRGTVTALDVGDREPRPQVPTLLEGVTARHGIKVMWGSAAGAFVLIASWWRWWKEPK